MDDTPSRKDLTHARIVDTAARIIRRSGYDGTGVADIMKEAGLTHGGFYAHFPSKSVLLAEAAEKASAEGLARLQNVAQRVPEKEALAAIIDGYLSRSHVASAETGCAVAALGSEMPRQAPEVRQVVTHGIKEFIDLIERHLPESQESGRREQAIGVMSCMVGALVLARAVDDTDLSSAICDAARQFTQSRLEKQND